MKKILLLILFMNIFGLQSQAQITSIPDAAFEAKLIQLNIDSDGLINGQMLTSDAVGVNTLSLSNSSISDLTGVAAFVDLQTLACKNNQLTSLDLSSNLSLTSLQCDDNQLVNLNISNNTNLQILTCTANQLTSLNVANNTALVQLRCDDNQLTSLDVSNNVNLSLIRCINNQLSTLDVSNNLVLGWLYCVNNQLTNLNVSNNSDLQILSCSHNQLTSLDVSNNSLLDKLYSTDNQLTSLDVSNNPLLDILFCAHNQLTSLNISNNPALTALDCQSNAITNLNAVNNTNLITLNCDKNQLTSLMLPSSTALDRLYCSYNQLTSLDVSNNPSLTTLSCGWNQLANLDLFNNSFLMNLTAVFNQFSYLNLKDKPLASCYANNNLANLMLCVDDSVAVSTNANWTKDLTATYTEICPNTTLVGYVKKDTNNNCQVDNLEPIVQNVMVQISSATDTIYEISNTSGRYSSELDSGTYTLSVAPPSPYVHACITPKSVTIDSINDLDTVNWALETTHYCPYLTASIGAPFLRMTGGGSAYTISYCNDGTAAAYGAYIEVEIDSFLNVLGTGLPVASQVGNVYTFNLDTIDIGECGSFTINVIVDTSAEIGQTHCSAVHIYPDSLCNNTWSGPIIQADGVCDGNTVTFEVKNVGGAMAAPRNYVVIEDNLVMYTSPFTLGSGANTSVQIPAQIGKTYRIEAEQAVGFPPVLGPHVASANIQNCNLISANLNIPLMYYNGNPAPWIDTDCQANIAAYDPNDKTPQPLGYGSQHYIERGTPLNYKVRFQNTGNDTAFNIVILDTISTHLDLTTLQMKATSHNYTWQIVNGHTLRVNFPNIKLVDSLTNEPLSHGFFSYEIQQKPNLPLGTVITNEAAIYFDYNPPIFTNTTFHTIGENYLPIVLNMEAAWIEEMQVHIYPNPTSGLVYIEQLMGKDIQINVLDNLGRVVLQQRANDKQTTIDLNDLPQGIYYVNIQQEKNTSTHKVVKH